MTEQLIAELVERGVDLATEEGSVMYEGAADAIDEKVLASLKSNKEAVLRRLRFNAAQGVIALAPTTFEQRRMFHRQASARDPSSWNIAIRVELAGSDVPDRMSAAVARLVLRHEAFRTRFVSYEGTLLQEVLAAPVRPLQIVQADSAQEGPESLETWCRDTGRREFDLQREPAARWVLRASAAGRHTLMMVFHHIIMDGWSLEIVCRELFGVSPPTTSEGYATVPTMRDYARWESRAMSPAVLEEEAAYWDSELEGTYMWPDGVQQGRTTSRHVQSAHRAQFDVAENVSRRLTAVIADLGITEFAFCLSAYAVLLRKTTQRDDFVVLLSTANRSRSDHDDLIGVLRNHVLVRCRVRPDLAFAEFAADTAETLFRAMTHQSFPAAVLESRYCVHPGRMPPMFGMSATPGVEMPHDLSASTEDVFLGGARTEICLLVSRNAAAMAGFFESSEQHWTPSESAALAEHYGRILQSAALTPQGSVGGL